MKGPHAPHTHSPPSHTSVGHMHHTPQHNHAPVRLPPLLLILPQKLTESNLSSWTSQSGAHTGLGLLSAIAQMGGPDDLAYGARDYIGETPRFLYSAKATSLLHSLSSSGSFQSGPSSAASMTPVSSPDIKKSEIQSPEGSRDTKRRQRLGPSCDLCRSRKVKCNAEVQILTNAAMGQDELRATFSLSAEEYAQLVNGSNVPIRDGLFFVMSNGKLIRFRACKSCNVKRLNCCFSNGFTKEDIISNKKKPSFKKAGIRKLKPAEESPVVAHPAISKALLEQREEENGRKSLCVSCRKRKVKCVFNEERQSCEVCTKKGSDCVFGKSKV